MGAAFVFTAGRRFPYQSSDTTSAWRHIPMFEYSDSEELWDHIPFDCVPIAIELDERARPLERLTHPERAIYILGAEDNGLPKRVLERAAMIVQLPGSVCLNVAVAGSIVMYDRIIKRAD